MSSRRWTSCGVFSTPSTTAKRSGSASRERGRSATASLKRALGEPAVKHASRPFCTFQDAPVGGVYREMLDKGYGAACVVRLSKWTMEHAGDPSAWRAVDTLSFSDFASEAFGGDDAKAAAARSGSRRETRCWAASRIRRRDRRRAHGRVVPVRGAAPARLDRGRRGRGGGDGG